MAYIDFVNEDRFDEMEELSRSLFGPDESYTVYLTDITGTIGEWLDMGFDSEVPIKVINLLKEVYAIAVNDFKK